MTGGSRHGTQIHVQIKKHFSPDAISVYKLIIIQLVLRVNGM